MGAKKTTKKGPTRAAVAEAIRSTIFKKIGQKQVALNFSTMPHVASGSMMIDDLIGGTLAQDGKGPVCPGYPRRCITEIYGPESSGKTTAALEAIVENQKAGGLAMFLDFEHALHHGYAKALGVSFDKDKLLLYDPDTFEEGLRMMFYGIQAGADLIVVDSVASMVPKSELEKSLKDPATIGALARAMSLNLPKIGVWLHKPEYTNNPLGTAVIFINQERALISTGPGARGGGVNTAGGKALKFYAYLRLKFTRLRSDMVEKKDKFTGKKKRYPFGNHTQVKVVKSKIDAKQGFTSDIFIRYGQGIDDHYSIIEAGSNNKVIQKKGGWFHYNGEKYQGRESLRQALLSNPKLFQEIRASVLEAVRDQTTTVEAPAIDDDEAKIVSLTDEGFDEGEATGWVADSEADSDEVDEAVMAESSEFSVDEDEAVG
jgi:recombination protein RecA